MGELPYEDGEVDVVVLDPPYLSNPTSATALKTYNTTYNINASFEAQEINSMDDVLDVYRDGMVEARRVARQAWVKRQDAHTSGKFHLNHITIHDMAVEMGWKAQDLFILVPGSKLPMRHPYQKSSRTAHFFLWVFV